jgi:hypothetical protein
MAASVGVLTQTGGKTSHAAVVCRGFGKTCVTGLTELALTSSSASLSDETVVSGSWVAICGETGKVWFNTVPDVDTLTSGHVGHDLMRVIAKNENTQVVGDLDDVTEIGAAVLDASLWNDPYSELSAIAQVCKMDKVDPTKVTIDLRDRSELNHEDHALFLLAGAKGGEADRIECAQLFEKTKKGSGFRYVTSLPNSGLPGASGVSSLSDLMKPGIVTPDPSFASIHDLQAVLTALQSAGHTVPQVMGEVSTLDQIAFRVLA